MVPLRAGHSLFSHSGLLEHPAGQQHMGERHAGCGDHLHILVALALLTQLE